MRLRERLQLLPEGQVHSAIFFPHRGHKPGQSGLQSSTVGIWNRNSWQSHSSTSRCPFSLSGRSKSGSSRSRSFNPSTPLQLSLPAQQGPDSGRTLRAPMLLPAVSSGPLRHPVSASKQAVTGWLDPCTGKILCRQITGKLCMVGSCAGYDKLSQVKLHSTPHKRLLC